ncbi:hypothetical protein O9929_24575 [Vibrio lentus]|nr:hypothetical protein [Vibrio lentus]
MKPHATEKQAEQVWDGDSSNIIRSHGGNVELSNQQAGCYTSC